MSAFGAPFDQIAANNAFPQNIEILFQTVGKNYGYDIFAVSYRGNDVAMLKRSFDSSGAQVLKQSNPILIGGLFILFFKSFNVPLVPFELYPNFCNIATINSQRLRLNQLRAFFSKLPASSNYICSRLFNCLYLTQLNPMSLANTFAASVARMQNENPDMVNPQIASLISECITNFKYVFIIDKEPILTDHTPENGNENLLIVKVIYDYNSTIPNTMPLRTGETVVVLNAHPDGWLEGLSNGVKGFLPSGFVELVPAVGSKGPIFNSSANGMNPNVPQLNNQPQFNNQYPTQPNVPMNNPQYNATPSFSPIQNNPNRFNSQNSSSPSPFNSCNSSPNSSSSNLPQVMNADAGGSLGLKVVVVGSGGVGKSALTICFVQNHFVVEYDPTIEDSYRKQVTIDGNVFFLNILDTAGQEEYSAMRDLYVRKGNGFLLVFSLTSRSSFDELGDLRAKVLQVKEADSVPFIIAANKWDLHNQHEVKKEEAEAFARTINCECLMTSAKDHYNVDECFIGLVRLINQRQAPKKKKSESSGGFRCSIL